MEDPNLSFSKSICSKDPVSPSEESGWTSYFDEFFASEKRKTAEKSGTNFCDSSSLVSDASWKPQVSSPPLMKKKKKNKTRIVFEDDALEDTATSTVNSPKEKMAEDGQGKDLEKRRIEEMSHVGGVSEMSKQRKKGLCLGPFSMFINNL
ncbi:uncharacterized protein LOC110018075 [Phalaenopsis equestris]|uniref:uncharacterized protein LOC110018075 n=1 Tax=Phalaenopsis equestris TaxID=78828 RepID=UPI0009E1FCB5|nr:uncharacterized protein LOC110018075 [Phalaenopsis equestris]